MENIVRMLEYVKDMRNHNWLVFALQHLQLPWGRLIQINDHNPDLADRKLLAIEAWMRQKTEDGQSGAKIWELFKTAVDTYYNGWMEAPRDQPVQVAATQTNVYHIVNSTIDAFAIHNTGAPGDQENNTVEQAPKEVPPTITAVSRPAQLVADSAAPPERPNNYTAASRGKGRVLIISNFETVDLSGYSYDVERLQQLWESLNCEVDIAKDTTKEKLMQTAINFCIGTKEIHRLCAVFVLSHGEEGDFISCQNGDGVERVWVTDIIELFSNNNRGLIDIPKLFFFQMCRGQVTNQGAVTAAVQPPKKKIPSISDMLLCYATQAGNTAIVDPDGSWFIKAIVSVFKNHASREHVVDMMTMVNDDMAEFQVRAAEDPTIIGGKSMSEFRSTLRKRLYLKPPQTQYI